MEVGKMKSIKWIMLIALMLTVACSALLMTGGCEAPDPEGSEGYNETGARLRVELKEGWLAYYHISYGTTVAGSTVTMDPASTIPYFSADVYVESVNPDAPPLAELYLEGYEISFSPLDVDAAAYPIPPQFIPMGEPLPVGYTLKMTNYVLMTIDQLNAFSMAAPLGTGEAIYQVNLTFMGVSAWGEYFESVVGLYMFIYAVP
jgi:hypothetical protein